MTYTPNYVTTPAGINAELTKIKLALDECLKKNDPAGNQLSIDLDLNGNNVINLPIASLDTDPVRLLDLNNYVDSDLIPRLIRDYGLSSGYDPTIWDQKQNTLVSGSNIKTINGVSLLGSGNIVLSGGGGTLTHGDLDGRDSEDQHPISSITGLQASLDSKAASTHTHSISDVSGLQSAIDSKQASLVSGANIKTINGTSLLGSGDIVISGGGGGTTDHSVLTNRDIADQHPISAITGLSAYTAKVDGIAAGATVNSSDATLLNRANHTGTQAISTVTNLQITLDGKASTSVATTGANGLMSSTDKIKLDSVASGATANSSDATLLARANHTGTQAISTVTGLQTALDAKQSMITVGTTAPASPVTNQLWLDTN